MSDSNEIPNDPIGSDLVREDPSFADLVVTFVDGLGERLSKMEDALRAADFETLRVAAHQLKGSGGGYGYPILTDRAYSLEKNAAEHEMEACRSSIEALRAVCERVVVEPSEPT